MKAQKKATWIASLVNASISVSNAEEDMRKIFIGILGIVFLVIGSFTACGEGEGIKNGQDGSYTNEQGTIYNKNGANHTAYHKYFL